MSDIQSVITQLRRLYLHMLQGAHITPDDLSRQIAALEGGQADADTLTAAIQTHHDTKHPRGAAVLAPVDRALYTSAGIDHAVLGWSEGLDERRRAPAPVAGDV